ncbi:MULTISPECIES: helix-turn-helix domain-containing protein [unclassified Pseudofrankia]|uniref:helix-turn-helix domain-containing protein n=1 Tax=unclassified Pseudofrankia TaxID=2994372 RepID=UPI0008D9191A|nr:MULTISPECIES: helix-turn-helix domain-containing protein [unclassified Pseudofrankia]MDT3445070.1 helix-turn-helix domain-containing protein [Pseudofrankia sp. BMG5.37]OHV47386.1 CdaR family transcriptional regulator [Pseudofrankia sp. BMG5.36]
MQELLGRIAALDPQASLSLRVIACFDELIVGNVNTRGLLGAAASLAGCDAGFCQELPPRALRVTAKGALVADGPPCPTSAVTSEGITVWLDRTGPAHANDAIILERLALAVRVRHGRGRRDLESRRELGLLVDGTVPVEERSLAAARLNLVSGARYRIVAAPLFAVWESHPTGAEDVVATPFGPVHALVVPHDHEPVAATPSGTGLAARVENLHRSFSTAVVALRLCEPPRIPSVQADRYGGLVGLLADAPTDTDLPDVDSLDQVMTHVWGPTTLDALVRAGSVRQASRLAGVHHSTLQARLDAVTELMGFDPFDGIGRTRLGIAYLIWRLRNSRVLDLPAPTYSDSKTR